MTEEIVTHATIEVPLEAVFSVGPVQRRCKESQSRLRVSSETGSLQAVEVRRRHELVAATWSYKRVAGQ